MNHHLSPLELAFTVSLLAFGACGESTTPFEPAEHASPSVAAAASYTARDLNIPGAGAGEATSINAAGQVVVSMFIWQNGVSTDLGTLGGSHATGMDINDNGQVVGWSENRQGKTRAFRWMNGTMRSLGTLGGRSSNAFANNNRGHIVGQSQLATFDPDGNHIVRAFLWKNGVMADLGTLGGSHSSAWDINDAGQIVGWSQIRNGTLHPFLWENGVMRDLLPPGSANVDGRAYAINSAGVVVGQRNGRAFRYSGGVMRNLPLGTTGRSAAAGIRGGRIVGYLDTPAGARGFVFAGGNVTLLPLLPGGEDNFATAINGSGTIVGSTTLFDSNVRPTMWTP